MRLMTDFESFRTPSSIHQLIGSFTHSFTHVFSYWFSLQDDERWQLADPICTFIFAILVLFTTQGILRDISDILMERVPRQIDIDKLEQGMLQVRLTASIRISPASQMEISNWVSLYCSPKASSPRPWSCTIYSDSS